MCPQYYMPCGLFSMFSSPSHTQRHHRQCRHHTTIANNIREKKHVYNIRNLIYIQTFICCLTCLTWVGMCACAFNKCIHGPKYTRIDRVGNKHTITITNLNISIKQQHTYRSASYQNLHHQTKYITITNL